jgi:hypothetical protein
MPRRSHILSALLFVGCAVILFARSPLRFSDTGDVIKGITRSGANIEIELYSPRRFPVRNAAPILRIGSQEFILSQYKDGSTKTLIFTLTSEQFATVSNGDPVALWYGPSDVGDKWVFGPLDKGMLK